MGEPAFSLRGVGLTSASDEPILRDIDWSIAAGDVALVVGPSGSGKSRLLRLLNRLDEPSGEVVVLGKGLREWSPGDLRRSVGWVPQRPALGDGLVRTIIEAPVALGLLTRAELDQRWDRALEVAGLPPGIVDKPTGRLSGGEKLRVGLARAVLLEPRILLLDEPTSALDGTLGVEVLTNLRAFAASRGTTLVVVTHRIEDLRTLGGTLLVLGDGRVVRCGPTAELLADPTGYDVAALLTGRVEKAR